MTKYLEYGVNLSDGQKQILQKQLEMEVNSHSG